MHRNKSAIEINNSVIDAEPETPNTKRKELEIETGSHLGGVMDVNNKIQLLVDGNGKPQRRQSRMRSKG